MLNMLEMEHVGHFDVHGMQGFFAQVKELNYLENSLAYHAGKPLLLPSTVAIPRENSGEEACDSFIVQSTIYFQHLAFPTPPGCIKSSLETVACLQATLALVCSGSQHPAPVLASQHAAPALERDMGRSVLEQHDGRPAVLAICHVP
ncbi:hypothetical protein SRHO_G00007660 [Serrasalmus rhombeus]